MKRCSRCNDAKLKISFHKDKQTKDGLYNQCNFCKKQYCDENLVKIKDSYLDSRDRIKLYYSTNQDYQLKNEVKNITRIKIYSNNRCKTDNIFRLHCKVRNRIEQVLR